MEPRRDSHSFASDVSRSSAGCVWEDFPLRLLLLPSRMVVLENTQPLVLSCPVNLA